VVKNRRILVAVYIERQLVVDTNIQSSLRVPRVEVVSLHDFPTCLVVHEFSEL
jgi:hypothetical protein